MKKVITYGTFDLLHFGHQRLLERAKALGDYLIVGVTSEDFDRRRGKINVQQSLMERIENVKKLGLADEIIVEEYEGQKIDDIINYGVDLFAIGSDWVGKFDYLKEYCDVVYLDRTEGISSTQIRSEKASLKLGIVGSNKLVEKAFEESKFANGASVVSFFTDEENLINYAKENDIKVYNDYNEFLNNIDAVYIASTVSNHYLHIKNALNSNKHVLCEAPICASVLKYQELNKIAMENNLIFMSAIKTAYSTAFNRLVLLAKSGAIGKIISVESTCTSLKELQETDRDNLLSKQNSMYAWGATALLPVFRLLGTKYIKKQFSSYYFDKDKTFDLFTKIDFNYSNAVASVKVGKGVKSEGELIVSGTKGYIYVPAPWWKTDYFEIRYENMKDNKRYFYKLDGEGIRNEFVTFIKMIQNKKNNSYVNDDINEAIIKVMEDFDKKIDLYEIIGE